MMNHKFLFALSMGFLVLFNWCNLLGQANLFTVAGEPVQTDEFKYVYEKNNRDDKGLYSEASIAEYLDLYVNFKLKVKEAESIGLQDRPSFKQELNRYREQLADSYMNEREVTDELLQEAYEHSKEERKIAHLLMLCDNDTPPEDTLRIFEEMKIIREEIRSGGKTFEKAAQTYSEDVATKPNGGDLGYITAFSTIYPFEKMAYQIEKDGLSPIFRTRFGYHLLTVTDTRESKGKIEAAHILLKIPKFADKAYEAGVEEMIKVVYQELEASGTDDFSRLAKKYSEDKSTAPMGGSLGWFGIGKWVKEFDKVAFGLQNPGDYSKPFKTEYGWHIVKLLDKRPIGTFADMKTELLRKVKKDSRSETSRQRFVNRLKKESNFKTNQANYDDFIDHLDFETFTNARFEIRDKKQFEKTLFTANGRDFSQLAFAQFILKNQEKGKYKRVTSVFRKMEKFYDAFTQQELIKLERTMLEKKYPEFRRLMKEYRDGILLFDLTREKVWDKAANDTVGLQSFYEANKNNYLFDNRLKATIFNCDHKATAKMLSETLLKRQARKRKGKRLPSLSMVLEPFNGGEAADKVSYEEGTFEKGDNDIIDSIQWEEGISRIITHEDGSVTFVLVEEVVQPTPKPLELTRGFVISDYQEQLEKEWVAELKQKYAVNINEQTVRSLYQK